MLLDLTLNTDCLKAESYLKKLIKDKSGIELKKIHKRRTNKQNRYLHAIFALFGAEFGYTIEESKIVVKRALNYTYEKDGQKFLKRTSEMDVKELTIFIDKFRNYSSVNGCYLPSADEFDTNYIEIMKQVSHYEQVW